MKSTTVANAFLTYRSDAVKDYCGIDVTDKDQCCMFVKNEISFMLSGADPQ